VMRAIPRGGGSGGGGGGGSTTTAELGEVYGTPEDPIARRWGFKVQRVALSWRQPSQASAQGRLVRTEEALPACRDFVDRSGRALRVFASWGGARLEDECAYLVRGTEASVAQRGGCSRLTSPPKAVEVDAATGNLRVRLSRPGDSAVTRVEGRSVLHPRPPPVFLPLAELSFLPLGSAVDALGVAVSVERGGAALIADASYATTTVLAPNAKAGQLVALLGCVARAGELFVARLY
jgi:hypothetical protein